MILSKKVCLWLSLLRESKKLEKFTRIVFKVDAVVSWCVNSLFVLCNIERIKAPKWVHSKHLLLRTERNKKSK